MKNFDTFGDSLKKNTFRECSQKTNIEGGLLKKGPLAVCRFKGVGLGKKEGAVFLRGG